MGNRNRRRKQKDGYQQPGTEQASSSVFSALPHMGSHITRNPFQSPDTDEISYNQRHTQFRHTQNSKSKARLLSPQPQDSFFLRSEHFKQQLLRFIEQGLAQIQQWMPDDEDSCEDEGGDAMDWQFEAEHVVTLPLSCNSSNRGTPQSQAGTRVQWKGPRAWSGEDEAQLWDKAARAPMLDAWDDARCLYRSLPIIADEEDHSLE